jgi:hypothetical protein
VESQHRAPLVGFVAVAVLSGFLVGNALHTQGLLPDDGVGRTATTASASPSEPGTPSADPSASGGVATGGVASGPGDPTTHVVVKSIGATPVIVPADGDPTLGSNGASPDPSTGGNGGSGHAGGGGVQARDGDDPSSDDNGGGGAGGGSGSGSGGGAGAGSGGGNPHEDTTPPEDEDQDENPGEDQDGDHGNVQRPPKDPPTRKPEINPGLASQPRG